MPGLNDFFLVIATSVLSGLFTFLITKKTIASQILSINRQKWLDGFRDTLAAYLSYTDLIAGMALAFYNRDPIIDKETAKNTYIKYLSEAISSEEKLLFYLDRNIKSQAELDLLIRKYSKYIHHCTGQNDFESKDIDYYVNNIRTLGGNIITEEWNTIKRNKTHKEESFN